MKSALYVGRVHHDRLAPRRHRFSFRLFFLYLDLDELERVFRGRWFWSIGRPNVAWFRRADYLGDPRLPLRQQVLERVEEELGRRPLGAVRMLTHLRTWGYVFNPVSFYYCFDAEDRLDAVVAEITNTPWRERHAYVLDAREGAGQVRARFPKAFHVSPFHGMDQVYEWRLSTPGEELRVDMTNVEDGVEVFHAGLTCRRRALDGFALARALLLHPLHTLRLHAAIYLQAGLLWLRRVPTHPHPATVAGLQDLRQP